ncbi:MAG: hypothetical protein K2N27_03035, partial [Ruminococcus sp.]|nr:hypothetical protein [Ruminococcus sp.]
MKNSMMKKRIMSVALSAVMSASAMAGTVGMTAPTVTSNIINSLAAEASVKINATVGYGEGMYATWGAVSGASGYNVYVDGVQIDSMLIRQYSGYMRADMVGLKAGSHTMKIVPVINGKEDSSKSAEGTASVYAHDRSGYAFEDNHSPGAYNKDGTLKSGAIVVYVTNATKDTVSVNLNVDGKGETACVGLQNIILGYKKGKETRPISIRIIGNITDPAVLTKGDIYLDTVTAGMTVEGIGADATVNGFGIVLKNCVDAEIRNLAFMNCNSEEGDDCGLQQGDSYCWVHNCDFFYGDAGSDADQVKGDGALDTKKSHHITHSYNHFFDNGKCNLQGANASDTSNYITYHHNWYDHSDSRHPRVRVATVHVYNNYYDGNAKYGVGSTTDSDVFVENCYFRNCKEPMLISKQGSEGGLVLSGETGGMIKAYGNVIEGAEKFVPYSENNTDFDAYVASSRDEKVPSSVKAKDGGATYNNFDTESGFYSYTPDKAEDVPAIVTAKAGRVDGGDFKWQFDNSVDDASYAVNTALKSALVAYKDSIVAIGSGFKEDSSNLPVSTTTTAPKATTTTVTTTNAPASTTTATPATGEKVIYASPDGKGDGKTMQTPTNVLSAIKSVQAGGTIYLLDGTYKFSEMITIDASNSGTAGNYKTISAYPGAKVVWDFSGQGDADAAKRGVALRGNYWHFYGFEITKAADNGMILAGSNNKIEMMVFNDNQDTGLQVSRFDASQATIADWPSYNLILNCTSKNNCDDKTMENADGFAAKLTCGKGNVFDGCMAYCNSDDGWDLFAKTETGPIGVVTLKNCIAFRNGFTEFGEGYGDCDGNGFKLGGSGVGSAHIVENCLAFENLNCGFTDNNNPKLGSLKDCTAYNNGVGGNGKPNVSCYRCTDTNTLFTNVMSYLNTSKVSDVGASGIKVSNDKLVGTANNTIYYNSKYYYAKTDTAMTNGAKLGDIITPADSDFINLTVPAMGTDFHTAWRNADGSPNPGGFAETNGTYKSVGYHMYNGVTPSTSQTTSSATTKPVQTTTTSVAPVVSGGQIHDFTANGTNSSFYTISGNLAKNKGTVNYDGKTLTQCLKMESATNITFNATAGGKLTLVFVEPTATVKVDGTKYTASGDGIITVDVGAGAHTIAKADTANLFYIVYSENGTTQTTASTSKTTTPTTATTGGISTPELLGDANCDGAVNIADATAIIQALGNKDKYGLSERGEINADCCNVGDGVTGLDALAIQ